MEADKFTRIVLALAKDFIENETDEIEDYHDPREIMDGFVVWLDDFADEGAYH